MGSGAHLSRVYRGAVLPLVWGAYESSLQEVAEFLRKRIPATLALSDLRGRTTFERARKYFPEVLKFELFTSSDAPGQLREIDLVRNAFAHTNGHLSNMSSGTRSVLDAMVAAGRLEESWGLVRPTKRFMEQALKLVDAEVTGLVERAKAWDDARPNKPKAEAAGGST